MSGEGLDPYKVSPSRVNSLLSCGIEFEMKYVQKLPPEVSGSAALFGSVVHKALENWGLDRSQSLLDLMEEAWLTVTEGTAAQEFIQAYKRLSREAIRVKHGIVERRAAKGWETKAVTMTKDWKQSNIKKRIDNLLQDWIPRLEADPKTIWRFTERDPLPSLYDDSLPLARRYEERWKHLPSVLHSEFTVEIDWREWSFKCYIDAVEALADLETGELALYITDYKTYARKPPPMKDWRQCAMYYAGWLRMLETGMVTLPPELADLPVRVGIDYVRWQDNSEWRGFPPRKYWEFGEDDLERLEQELRRYSNIVERGDFLPAEKGRNPDFCDFPGQCCLRNCDAAGGGAVPVAVTLL